MVSPQVPRLSGFPTHVFEDQGLSQVAVIPLAGATPPLPLCPRSQSLTHGCLTDARLMHGLGPRDPPQMPALFLPLWPSPTPFSKLILPSHRH